MTSVYFGILLHQKRGSVKTFLFRAHTICSNKELLDKDVKHSEHVFITINGFPPRVVLQVISRVEKKFLLLR